MPSNGYGNRLMQMMQRMGGALGGGGMRPGMPQMGGGRFGPGIVPPYYGGGGAPQQQGGFTPSEQANYNQRIMEERRAQGRKLEGGGGMAGGYQPNPMVQQQMMQAMQRAGGGQMGGGWSPLMGPGIVPSSYGGNGGRMRPELPEPSPQFQQPKGFQNTYNLDRIRGVQGQQPQQPGLSQMQLAMMRRGGIQPPQQPRPRTMGNTQNPRRQVQAWRQ
jgi:hypothetical protein